MSVTIQRVMPDGRAEPEAPVALTAIRRDAAALRWVDLHEGSVADLRRRLGELDVPEAAIARTTDPAGQFEVIVEEHAVCFNLTAPAAWWQQADRAVVHVFVLDRVLVTAHVEPFPELERALHAMTHLDPRLPPTTFGLMVALLRIFYAADGQFFRSLRSRTDRMEAVLDSSIADFRLDELIATERAVLRVSETWLDNEMALRRMAGIAVRALDVTAQTGTIDVLAEAIQVFRQSLVELDKRLDKDHRHYESVMQTVTERRLRFLTVISAIFLPLSLIAGIYGMNFADIPELHFRYGYEVILGCMIALAAGALLYFSRKGWFR